MKTADIREKNSEELMELLIELRKKQFGLRMQSGYGQEARSSDIREARKDIARIKTIMTQRSVGDLG
jgi:large subunit ribosomal protein L29